MLLSIAIIITGILAAIVAGIAFGLYIK